MVTMIDNLGCKKFQIIDCTDGCGFDISVEIASCTYTISVSAESCDYSITVE
jgi:hypothetical protein